MAPLNLRSAIPQLDVPSLPPNYNNNDTQATNESFSAPKRGNPFWLGVVIWSIILTAAGMWYLYRNFSRKRSQRALQWRCQAHREWYGSRATREVTTHVRWPGMSVWQFLRAGLGGRRRGWNLDRNMLGGQQAAVPEEIPLEERRPRNTVTRLENGV